MHSAITTKLKALLALSSICLLQLPICILQNFSSLELVN